MALTDRFPKEQLTVTGRQDFGRTGNFEVRILNNNSLIHSRATRGQGLCRDPKEVEAVVMAIEDFLEAPEEGEKK